MATEASPNYPYVDGLLARRSAASASAFSASLDAIPPALLNTIELVLDIGAGDGSKAAQARSKFPAARWLLVEPDAQLVVHARNVTRMVSVRADASIAPAVAGRALAPTCFLASHVAYYIPDFTGWLASCLANAGSGSVCIVVVRAAASDSFALREVARRELGLEGRPTASEDVERQIEASDGLQTLFNVDMTYQVEAPVNDHRRMDPLLSLYGHLTPSQVTGRLRSKMIDVLTVPGVIVHHDKMLVVSHGIPQAPPPPSSRA